MSNLCFSKLKVFIQSPRFKAGILFQYPASPSVWKLQRRNGGTVSDKYTDPLLIKYKRNVRHFNPQGKVTRPTRHVVEPGDSCSWLAVIMWGDCEQKKVSLFSVLLEESALLTKSSVIFPQKNSVLSASESQTGYLPIAIMWCNQEQSNATNMLSCSSIFKKEHYSPCVITINIVIAFTRIKQTYLPYCIM